MLNCNGHFAEDISPKNELYRLEIYVNEGTCVKKTTKPSRSLRNGSSPASWKKVQLTCLVTLV